ncbi:MAG TPA: AraC family transcriptional regulator [Spirochaetota bacterium]|nr:AraC family transcriptional regulator [Spirochaetota bacterium]
MNKNKILILLLFIFLSISISIAYLIFTASRNIFPETDTRIYPITDHNDSGNSEIISINTNNGQIDLQYILRDGFAFPYAGVGIEILSSVPLYSSGFDFFEITAKTSKKTSLKINIITKVNLSDKKNTSYPHKISYYYYTSIIDITPEFSTIRVPLSDFLTPEWFLVKHKIEKKSIDSIGKNPLWSIEILNSSIDELNTPLGISITYFGFKKDIFYYSILSMLIISVLALLGLFLSHILKSHKAVKYAQDIIRIHSNLNLGNEKEREAGKLFEYLAANYNDPYISVQQISEALNLSPYKIPKIINKYTNLSFKQYINLIRVDEAKNLLINSDSKIIDIAFAIGYNSIAHFNKLFKMQESLSPKEYRQKYQTGN